MSIQFKSTDNARICAPADDVLAIHVMQLLTSRRSAYSLEEVAAELEVRKADVRRVVSLLHRQGFMDALRMRPTLAGFALGRAVRGVDLVPLREIPLARESAQAA